jgi:hypothetical protein
MTAVQPSKPSHQASSSLGVLRQVMIADALFTAVAGVGLLAGADPLAEEAGLATTGPLVAVGAFFVVLAALVAGLGRAPEPAVRRLVPLNGIGDVAWAVMSVVAALAADLSGRGRAVVLVQAVAVFAIGEAKLVLARRARSSAKIVG